MQTKQFHFLDNQQLQRHTLGAMTIVLADKNELKQIRETWQFLEKQSKKAGLLSSWDWVESWLEQYGDVVAYWFAVGIQDGQVCGIALITKETKRSLPLPVKAFHIGTYGEPYADATQAIGNTVLVMDQARNEFYQALIATIQHHFSWEEIVFDQLEQSEATVVEEILKQISERAVITRELCRTFDFSLMKTPKTSILDQFGSETRYTIKRSMKALGNKFQTEWAENEEQALSILDEMIILYQQMWDKRGRRGMFASSRFSAFQRNIIKKLVKKGSLLYFRVKHEEFGTLGCVSMLVSDGVAYGYQIGLKDFTDVPLTTINKKRLRVGFIVHSLFMQECYKRGIKVYNFGIGEYDYKREMANATSEVVTISLRRNYLPTIRDFMVKLHNQSTLSQKLLSWLLSLR